MPALDRPRLDPTKYFSNCEEFLPEFLKNQIKKQQTFSLENLEKLIPPKQNALNQL